GSAGGFAARGSVGGRRAQGENEVGGGVRPHPVVNREEPPAGGSFFAHPHSEGTAEKGRALEAEAPWRVDSLRDPDPQAGRDRSSAELTRQLERRAVQREAVVRPGHAERLTEAAGARAELADIRRLA